MQVADCVQKCVNLMEATNDAQQETRAFRSHCHDVAEIVSNLWPTVLEAEKRNPNLCELPGAGEVFDTLNTVLEDALVTVRKCACMTQFDKLIDQGETKRHLIALRENLFKRCREVHSWIMQMCPPKRRKSPASSSMPASPSSIGASTTPGPSVTFQVAHQ